MLQDVLSWITAIANILLLVGLYLAYRQLKAAREATKAQVLMKLSDEWRSKELYEAAIFIHNLRDEWKKLAPVTGWSDLARKWVEEHKDPSVSNGPAKQKEWFMRRTASQFLAKMGSLMQSGYLTPNEFFGVVPETGRLLAVLIPIEFEIVKYFTQKEQSQQYPIAEWDCPFGKWEFNDLWKQYKTWYKKNRLNFELKPLEWLDLS